MYCKNGPLRFFRLTLGPRNYMTTSILVILYDGETLRIWST